MEPAASAMAEALGRMLPQQARAVTRRSLPDWGAAMVLADVRGADLAPLALACAGLAGRPGTGVPEEFSADVQREFCRIAAARL